MDSRKHSKFIGSKASVSRKVGGKFSTFDGYAEGVNLELVPDKKVVQSWRASDWPEGHFSKATFQFEDTPAGSRLTFIQTGVPEEQYQAIKDGWVEFYWTPMKVMLGG